MSDDYVSESKFLTKNYKAFLYEYLQEFKHGNDTMHLHPPPAFRDIYDLVMRPYLTQDDEINYSDLVTMMDMVAKFMSFLNRNGIDYQSFSECSCTRITDADLALLLESGGENR